MPGEQRLIQLSRMFATPIEDDEAARTAIETRPGDFASAVFLEAADSDDVTSRATALDYLATRLADFAGTDRAGSSGESAGGVRNADARLGVGRAADSRLLRASLC